MMFVAVFVSILGLFYVVLGLIQNDLLYGIRGTLLVVLGLLLKYVSDIIG